MFESSGENINQAGLDSMNQDIDQLKREIRNLFHLKQDRMILGEGEIIDDEGEEGQIHLRVTDDGVRLLIKAGGQWFKFKPEEEE
tara:strand:+ start:1215 stop:1469 length:255 start_codon:yes stop_codon:yes gene_type:complete